MDEYLIRELRQKYIKNPPKGITPALIRNMTDSDLLDMHYSLTEDDDLDGDGLEWRIFIISLSSTADFPIIQKQK